MFFSLAALVTDLLIDRANFKVSVIPPSLSVVIWCVCVCDVCVCVCVCACVCVCVQGENAQSRVPELMELLDNSDLDSLIAFFHS